MLLVEREYPVRELATPFNLGKFSASGGWYISCIAGDRASVTTTGNDCRQDAIQGLVMPELDLMYDLRQVTLVGSVVCRLYTLAAVRTGRIWDGGGTQELLLK